MKKNKKEVKITATSTNTKAKKVIKNTAQKTIPFIEIYDNALMLVEAKDKKERYSMTFALTNANYNNLKDEDKTKKLKTYQKIFNTLSADIHYQELYINTPLDAQVIYDAVASKNIPQTSDYGKAYYLNQLSFVRDIENHITDTVMYFSLSYEKKSKLDNAYNIIMQAYGKISDYFQEFGAKTSVLSTVQILKLFHTIYNPFDDNFILPKDMYAKGTNIRDYIAPSSFYFKPKYTALGSDYNRVLYVSAYSNTLDDEFISKIIDNKFKICVSKHIDHVDKDIALKLVNNRLKELEGNKQERNKKNAQNNTNYIPYDLQRDIDTCLEILDTIEKSEELFDVGIYISISAQSMEDLEDITKIIVGACREHLVTVKNAVWRQEDGIASIVPISVDKLKQGQYLLSSAVAVTLPFTYKKLFTNGGFYYGKNKKTHAPIIVNRKMNKNGNGFYLGKSGSGKSLYAKMEINDVFFNTTTDQVIIIDPEREFVSLTKELSGEVIKISSNTENYINPFEIIFYDTDEGSIVKMDDNTSSDKVTVEDLISRKNSLILSLMRVFKGSELTAKEKSVIDRCVGLSYVDYRTSNYNNDKIPTLETFLEILKKQAEKDIAADLVLYLEMYVKGSANIFSKPTNINFKNRVICFDVLDLGENLKSAGMLILLDFIQNQMILNRSNGVYTWLYVDEFHLFYDNCKENDEHSTDKLFNATFARCRKYGGLATGLTQNITSVVENRHGLSMLQNSEFVVLLEQAKNNCNKIAELYELSNSQAEMLIATNVGEGIIVSDKLPIPFNKLYPQDNLVYDIITTDFKDKIKALSKNKV